MPHRSARYRLGRPKLIKVCDLRILTRVRQPSLSEDPCERSFERFSRWSAIDSSAMTHSWLLPLRSMHHHRLLHRSGGAKCSQDYGMLADNHHLDVRHIFRVAGSIEAQRKNFRCIRGMESPGRGRGGQRSEKESKGYSYYQHAQFSNFRCTEHSAADATAPIASNSLSIAHILHPQIC